MPRPWAIVTGATGFLGSQLVRHLRREFHVCALGRRSLGDSGLEAGPGVRYFQVDLADSERLRAVFRTIRDLGAVDLLIHLAAHYDFTGEDSPEYTRTNVNGTRALLELAVPLQPRQLIYVSSLLACPFPTRGQAVTESTPASAPIPYARSKRVGEEMVAAAATRVPAAIVRAAAIFSDWCEYEPLYHFFDAWLSDRWDARVLGGRGESAIPFLHVDDLVSFCMRVVERSDSLGAAEVLIASPDGATSHRELYAAATRSWFGHPRRPVQVPRLAAALGVRVREWWGRRNGRLPFERSWMVDFIDRRLDVDATHTRRRLDWAPNPELDVLRRIPAMIENLRERPDEWRLRRLRKQYRGIPGAGCAGPHVTG